MCVCVVGILGRIPLILYSEGVCVVAIYFLVPDLNLKT